MRNDRVIQLVALVVMVVGMAASGAMLPPILRTATDYSLRYTDEVVKGAPPVVTLGTAIGALRGLIVDYLWIKVNIRKQNGQFYEIMDDADLITKLQPRFASVWAFHGHNMAYNISVMTHTQQERWDWVNAGIRLVQNRGLRYNPNDLVLHKELSFWYAHKIEAVSDDAHLYYKRQLAGEWHLLLGEPPAEVEARLAWIKEIADAPATLEEAELRTPGVRALLNNLRNAYEPFKEQYTFALDRNFLGQYTYWQAVTNQVGAAAFRERAIEQAKKAPAFIALDTYASDSSLTEQWKTLIAYAKKRSLLDEYNMDPRLMYEYTRDLGPIDWRSGFAHSLYWSRRGSQLGERRIGSDEDIYKIINNDRQEIQALQGLARNGRISFDIFSNELPGRLSDRRFVPTIEKMFEHLYIKHYDTRGAGGETFINFLENFLSGMIRELYRAGEIEDAKAMMARLDARFGRGAQIPNNKYAMDLDIFVREGVQAQYEVQPYLAASDVNAALRNGLVNGVGMDRCALYDETVKFSNWVTDFFKGNSMNDFVTKFGEARIGDLLGELEHSKKIALSEVMMDETIPITHRTSIWRNLDKCEKNSPLLRLEVYDFIRPALERQFMASAMSQKFSFEEAFPTPPGMEAFRVAQAARESSQREDAARRAEMERRSDLPRARDTQMPQ